MEGAPIMVRRHLKNCGREWSVLILWTSKYGRSRADRLAHMQLVKFEQSVELHGRSFQDST
jgi:hypothetical protein